VRLWIQFPWVAIESVWKMVDHPGFVPNNR
jgi:hypothetical protein